MDEVLLVKDVMEMLSVSKPTMYKLIRDGKIRAINLGTERRPIYRIRRSDLLEDLQKLSS